MHLAKLRTLGVKVESTEGTYDAPGAADAIMLIEEPNWNPIIEKADRPAVRNTLTPLQKVRTLGKVEITFSFEMKGEDTTADSIPSWAKIFTAAGFLVTQNVGTSVAITPSDALSSFATIPSYSLLAQLDGYALPVRGARVASMALNCVVGDRWVCTVTMNGILEGDDWDTSSLFDPSFSTQLPEVWHDDGVFTLDATPIKVARMAIDMGIEGDWRPDPNQQYGLCSWAVGGRAITGQLDPEFDPATLDYLEKLVTDTRLALVAKQRVGVTGKSLDIAMPYIEVDDHPEAQRGPIQVVDYTFAASGLATGEADEFTLTKQ